MKSSFVTLLNIVFWQSQICVIFVPIFWVDRVLLQIILPKKLPVSFQRFVFQLPAVILLCDGEKLFFIRFFVRFPQEVFLFAHFRVKAHGLFLAVEFPHHDDRLVGVGAQENLGDAQLFQFVVLAFLVRSRRLYISSAPVASSVRYAILNTVSVVHASYPVAYNVCFSVTKTGHSVKPLASRLPV